MLLTTHVMLRGGPPLTEEDHERLLVMLERVGFGWLRGDAVVAELERMWADHPSRGDHASDAPGA